MHISNLPSGDTALIARPINAGSGAVGPMPPMQMGRLGGSAVGNALLRAASQPGSGVQTDSPGKLAAGNSLLGNIDSASLHSYLDSGAFADSLVVAAQPAWHSKMKRASDTQAVSGFGALSNAKPKPPFTNPPNTELRAKPVCTPHKLAHGPSQIRIEPNLATPASDAIPSLRYSGRDIARRNSARVNNALRQVSAICREPGSAASRNKTHNALHHMTRDIVTLYKRAESDLLQGDQSLSDGEVRDKLRTAVRCTKACANLSLSKTCELELITAVEADVTKIDLELRPRSPAEFLDAVSRQTREPRASLIDASGHLNPALDPLLLNSAKELYRRWQVAGLPANRDGVNGPTMQDFNARTMQDFISELNVDFDNIRLATSLIPNALPTNGESPFWFDGLAIRGATGMSVEDIARHHGGAIELDKGVALVKLRFRHLGEDTHYILGTPQQSQATIILRMGPALGVVAVTDSKLDCMMARFEALVSANKEQGGFPVSPALMVARHLARTSGVLSSLTLDKEAQLTRELCTTKLPGLLQLTEAELQRPDESVAMDPSSDPSIPFRCDEVAIMAKAARSLTGTEIEAEAVAQYRALDASRAVMTAESSEDLNRQHLNYLDERWAAYELTRFGADDSHSDTNERSGTMPDHHTPALRAKAREVLRLAGLALTDKAIWTVTEIIYDAAAATAPLAAHKVALLRYQHEQQLQLHGSHISKQAAATDERIYLNAVWNSADPAWNEPQNIWSTVEKHPILHTVTDPAYQIDKAMWHGDSAAVVGEGMGANATGIHTWLDSLGDTKIQVDLERQITEVHPSAPITPLVSMLRDFYTETATKTRSLLPLGIEGAITEDGMSRPYELTYRSEHDHAALTLGPARLPAKLEASPLLENFRDGLSRSVQGTNNVMDALQESEAGTMPNESIFGVTIALPMIRNGSRSAPSVVNLDHFLRWTDNRVQSMTDGALTIINKSPLARRLARYAAVRRMQPFTITIAEGAPTISLDRKTITLAPEPSIEQHRYVSALARVPFRADVVALGQWLHAVTDMPAFDGARPDLERGAIVILTNQILYEANMHDPDRVMHGGTTDATAAQAAYSISEARLRALAEDRKLAPRFSNAHEPNLKILGIAARDRETVRAQADVTESLNRALLWRGFSNRAANPEVFQSQPETGTARKDAEAFHTAANALRNAGSYFNGMVNQWIDLQSGSDPWVAKFDAPRTFGAPGKPWLIDRRARTIAFFSGPTFYSTPFGPTVASWERRAAGALVELLHGRVAPVLLPHAAKTNRGYETLMTNIVLGNPSATRAVSAEFSQEPDVLWESIFSAAKAAEEEDSVMKNAADRLGALSRI